MRLILQRVKQAQVHVDSQLVGSIGSGILVFLGIGQDDNDQTVTHFIKKISELRIFNDEHGKMNLSASDVQAEFLVVSQFTLYGDCRKGRRPSFDKAATPQVAEQLYNLFCDRLQKLGFNVQTGQFQAMMDVSLVNDGPVTFILES